jgi:hypothetical protein
VDDARAYWQRVDATPATPIAAQRAFDEFWFGARSLARVAALLANFRRRFDAFPPALSVLHRWSGMSPDTRRLICHWHLQLADPLYRALTGVLFPARIRDRRAQVTRDAVVGWIGERPNPWTMTTRIELASKLLSAAFSAGLLTSRRDPRPLVAPRVPDDALAYLLYLLRGVDFAGQLGENPYLRSVGLDPDRLAERLRRVPDIQLRRAGALHDFTWKHRDLAAWADARLGAAA